MFTKIYSITIIKVVKSQLLKKIGFFTKINPLVVILKTSIRVLFV